MADEKTVAGAVSTKSPEPIQAHVDVFEEQAERETEIRRVMSSQGKTWPEAVAIVDGIKAPPDPLIARVAVLEDALASARRSYETLSSYANTLADRIGALEKADAPKIGLVPQGGADPSVQ